MSQNLRSLPFELRERIIESRNSKITLAYLVCLPLEKAGFLNAFSTRWGGVSPLPENALHLSYKNDALENVRENRKRFLKAIHADSFRVATTQQTHSDTIVTIDEPTLHSIHEEEQKEPIGDALISQLTNVLLGVKTADCLSLLIADPKTKTVAAVHAGWKSTLNRIVEKTIAKLIEVYAVDPSDCLAAMGPAACKDCYEVGSDVIEPFKKEFSYSDDLFHAHAESKEKAYLDVRLANALQLVSSGISPLNIFGAEECNMHQNELFFSHRKEGASSKAGRGLSVIGKRSSK